MSESITKLARTAAEKWFAGTRTEIETNRPHTGGSFADSANTHLDAAIDNLADIIEQVFTGSDLASNTQTVEWLRKV